MTKTITIRGVAVDELANIRLAIKAKYPDAPYFVGGGGDPIDLGHGYSLKWSYVDTSLILSLSGSSIFMGTATKKVCTLIFEIIGVKDFTVENANE